MNALNGPWTFTLGDPHNALCGVIRDSKGAIVCYRAVIDDADRAVMTAIAAAPTIMDELQKAESFISGFEGDDMQEGIDSLLASIRAAIAGTAADPARDAAPDMLATLRSAYVEVMNPGTTAQNGGDIGAAILAVIAKAEGRTNG